MIKYLSILYIVFLSYFLLEFSFSEIGYLKVSEMFPFNLKNTLSNSISTSSIFAIDSKAKLIDIMPQRNDTNTFFTRGSLSSVLFPDYNINSSINSEKDNNFKNESFANISKYEFPKIISGNWTLNVTQGNVTDFHSVFKLITSDGLEKHFVKINNFENNNNFSVILNPYTKTIINGYVDFIIDDQLFESYLPIKIQLNRINTIIISIDKQTVSDLLLDSPIYGVADSFKNFRNNELLVQNEQ
jgi:hypothetical protein